MNPAIVVMLYDRAEAQFELSVKAVESALNQDIPVDVIVIDNGSTCEKTKQWLATISNCIVHAYEYNLSPLKRGNDIMADLFYQGYPCVLGCPNDVILPPNLYRKMLERPEGIVAPGMHGANPPVIMEDVNRVHGDVHVSVVLIRKEAHDSLVQRDGYFWDEGYFMYASDCDLKLRLDGIETAQLDILCWHYGGASHRLAIGSDFVYQQADKDRAYFSKKWGFAIGDPEYNERMAKYYSQDQVNAKS